MLTEGSKRMRIVWQGKEISDVSQLPPELQALLEDRNGNGIPDVVEQAGSAGRVVVTSVGAPQTTIRIDGQSYDSLDAVPAELREQLRGLLASAQGTLSTEWPQAPVRPAAGGRTTPHVPRSQPAPAPTPSGEPAGGLGTSWLVLLAAALVGALVMYAVMRR